MQNITLTKFSVDVILNRAQLCQLNWLSKKLGSLDNTLFDIRVIGKDICRKINVVKVRICTLD